MILTLALCAFLCCVLEVQCQCVHPLLGARRIFTAKTVPKVIYQNGDIIHYKCADGYSFKDSSTPYHRSECYDHVWTPSLFKCYANTCKELKISNGYMRFEKKVYNGGRLPIDSIVTFACIPGYNLVEGPTKVSCRMKDATASWSAFPPKCLTIQQFRNRCAEENKEADLNSGKWFCRYTNTCKELKISNGYMRFEKKVYNGGRLPIDSIVTFACIPGYNLVEGPTKVSCRMKDATASWSAFPPKCLTIQQFRNRCAEENKEADLNSGKWFCRYTNTCKELKISNGYMRFEKKVYNGGRLPIDSIVTFACIPGYNLVEGPTKVSCRMKDATASWSAFPPKCLTIQQFRNRCAEENKEADLNSGKWFCRYKSPTSPLPHETEQHNHATDKTGKPLTIVTSTAGGLLLILLFVIMLVACQRKRLRRRRRGRGGCRRLSSDADDRLSFVYYSNDVHVVLPSYDEAMQNRLSAIPPPYAANDNNENLPTLPVLTGSSETADLMTATREAGQRVNSNALRLGENIYEAVEDVVENITNTIRNATTSQQTVQPAEEAVYLAGATQHSVANAHSSRDGEVEDQDEEGNAGNSLLDSSTQKPLYARLSSVKRRQRRNTKTGRHSKSRRHSKTRGEVTEALLGENSSGENDDDDADKPLEAGADVMNGNDVNDDNKSGE